jgi:hypothetical protein
MANAQHSSNRCDILPRVTAPISIPSPTADSLRRVVCCSSGGNAISVATPGSFLAERHIRPPPPGCRRAARRCCPPASPRSAGPWVPEGGWVMRREWTVLLGFPPSSGRISRGRCRQASGKDACTRLTQTITPPAAQRSTSGGRPRASLPGSTAGRTCPPSRGRWACLGGKGKGRRGVWTTPGLSPEISAVQTDRFRLHPNRTRDRPAVLRAELGCHLSRFSCRGADLGHKNDIGVGGRADARAPDGANRSA